MLIVDTTREKLVAALPSQGAWVEIGVNKGDFSEVLASSVHPKTLYLIDPWEIDGDYNRNNEGLREYHDLVQQRFASQIAVGSVVVCRGYAESFVDSFPNESLDGIYIDARQTYAVVKGLLTQFDPKISRDGFFMGHDFANHHVAVSKRMNAIPAVMDYARDNGLVFLALTLEPYPTYILGRADSKQSKRYQNFLDHVKESFVTEEIGNTFQFNQTLTIEPGDIFSILFEFKAPDGKDLVVIGKRFQKQGSGVYQPIDSRASIKGPFTAVPVKPQ